MQEQGETGAGVVALQVEEQGGALQEGPGRPSSTSLADESSSPNSCMLQPATAPSPHRSPLSPLEPVSPLLRLTLSSSLDSSISPQASCTSLSMACSPLSSSECLQRPTSRLGMSVSVGTPLGPRPSMPVVPLGSGGLRSPDVQSVLRCVLALSGGDLASRRAFVHACAVTFGPRLGSGCSGGNNGCSGAAGCVSSPPLYCAGGVEAGEGEGAVLPLPTRGSVSAPLPRAAGGCSSGPQQAVAVAVSPSSSSQEGAAEPQQAVAVAGAAEGCSGGGCSNSGSMADLTDSLRAYTERLQQLLLPLPSEGGDEECLLAGGLKALTEL